MTNIVLLFFCSIQSALFKGSLDPLTMMPDNFKYTNPFNIKIFFGLKGDGPDPTTTLPPQCRRNKWWRPKSIFKNALK